MDIFSNENKDTWIHPFYWTDETTKKGNKEWTWFEQANQTYKQIEKQFKFIPQINDTVYYFDKEKFIWFESQREVDLYKPKINTIPFKSMKTK